MIETLVIGGGPAGAAAAIDLARAGRSVVLLERETGPHDKVCGEFLSYEAEASLHDLGLDTHALGAVGIDSVDVCRGSRRIASPLPFRALSLSRRVMDEALLALASSVGVEVRRGVRATSIERGSQWTVSTDSGDAISAARVLLATGKHDIRGFKRPAGVQSDLIGFKIHWRLCPAQEARMAGRVELHLFRGGYAGLEPVEGGRVNLCLVVGRATFAAVGSRWEPLLASILAQCPLLAERLAGAAATTGKPLAIAAIPYGYVARCGADGLWRLGDQAAVIPSFAGEGMSIALHSGRMAAESLLRGESAEAFQRRIGLELRGQVGRATRISQVLVQPAGQAAIMTALRLAPGLIGLVARRTRLETWQAPATGPEPQTACA